MKSSILDRFSGLKKPLASTKTPPSSSKSGVYFPGTLMLVELQSAHIAPLGERFQYSIVTGSYFMFIPLDLASSYITFSNIEANCFLI